MRVVVGVAVGVVLRVAVTLRVRSQVTPPSHHKPPHILSQPLSYLHPLLVTLGFLQSGTMRLLGHMPSITTVPT